MATSTVLYEGNLRTTCTHIQSGQKIQTDAPTDNNGLGAAFSPTDLAATSLATCMITVMGIAAKERGLGFMNVTAAVTKIMAANPRRISEIQVELTIPDQGYTENQKEVLKRVGLQCPVAQSLHPDIKQTISFQFS